MSQVSRKNHFYCYSTSLMEFISEYNIRYILTARAISTNKQFFLYEMSEELRGVLEIYNSQKDSVKIS